MISGTCHSDRLLDLAPYQPAEQQAIEGVPTYQASHTDDKIATGQKIPGVTKTTIGESNVWRTNMSPLINYIEPHKVKNFRGEVYKLLTQ